MGSKTDGHTCDHISSKCCKKPIRFEAKADGYTIYAWCSECGNYMFSGRTETLIALWLGNRDAVIKNKGYIPEWVEAF